MTQKLLKPNIMTIYKKCTMYNIYTVHTVHTVYMYAALFDICKQ